MAVATSAVVAASVFLVASAGGVAYYDGAVGSRPLSEVEASDVEQIITVRGYVLFTAADYAKFGSGFDYGRYYNNDYNWNHRTAPAAESMRLDGGSAHTSSKGTSTRTYSSSYSADGKSAEVRGDPDEAAFFSGGKFFGLSDSSDSNSTIAFALVAYDEDLKVKRGEQFVVTGKVVFYAGGTDDEGTGKFAMIDTKENGDVHKPLLFRLD